MSFRHPANRRSAQAPYGDGMFFFTRPVGAPDEISEGEYGDGMFFFTRPVGAPDAISEAEYGDGAFFFTQPVGAPQSIRPGTYGRANAYGAAKAADVKKAGAGLRASLTKPTGGRTAPTISADAYKAFEKAAFDVGVWDFWTNFWGGSRTRSATAVSGTVSGEAPAAPVTLSDASQVAYADASAKLTAAKAALASATAPLLKGVSSDTAVRQALAVYTYALIEQGWYAQAFRGLSGATRNTSKLLTDAIVRDVKAIGRGPDVAVAQGYLLRDAQSAFTADDYVSAAVSLTKKGKKATQDEMDRYSRARAQAKSLALEILSTDFESARSRVRNEQVAARNTLSAAVSSAKSAFEAARTAAYAGKTLSLPTQQGGGTRRTLDTSVPSDTTAPADTTVPADGTAAPAPDITGGPPADAQTLERTTGEEQKVGFLTASGTGEESFVSKYKLWIGLGSVAAIGGGYWWYTQKYLPAKKLGR